MRLGLYGGTFDPIHYGHLLLAETCREQCKLDKVWFLPAAVPPHKQTRPISPVEDRVEMVKLALGGQASMEVSTIEIERGGVSYTVETLTQITALEPGVKLFFLMGADSLHDFHSWRQPERICELAIPVVVRRADSPTVDINVLKDIASPERLDEIRNFQVEMPVIELSSTEIRKRVRSGESIRYRTPRAVESFIETKQLYRESKIV
ncbi:MAG: nicotinate-nucleotide adenylyltransferase [Pirellulaceae bacterium]|jgi:nicotinate-nucleotide adenylyltransferase